MMAVWVAAETSPGPSGWSWEPIATADIMAPLLYRLYFENLKTKGKINNH